MCATNYIDTTITPAANITRDSPDCHKAIPFDPSKLYKFYVLAVIILLAVLAVFAILAVLTQIAVLAKLAVKAVLT